MSLKSQGLLFDNSGSQIQVTIRTMRKIRRRQPPFFESTRRPSFQGAVAECSSRDI